MMNNSLNEALKAKAAQKKQTTDGEIHLDDVARVKVLSPGRQVFKRFVRNRLAVFGSCLLIAMFIFSFIGPLFYAYGQKQIFYKYSTQNVNYALAKSNTAYNGYTVDESVELARPVVNAMNSNIKSMIEKGETSRLVFEGENAYLISMLGREVYTLGSAETELVCTTGRSEVHIGSYSMVGKKLTYADKNAEEIPGLQEAAAKACKGKGGSFELDGVTYTFEKGAAKSFDIYTERDGLVYASEVLGEEFEQELAENADQTAFTFEGEEYCIVTAGGAQKVYRLTGQQVGRVYTLLTLDTYETGARVPDDFRPSALMAAFTSGTFTSDGAEYRIEPEESGTLVVHDAAGEEYAEFTDFTVRRYTGEDTMDYDLKDAITNEILAMLSSGRKTGTLSYALPMQNETGSYVYDENGALQYNDSELTITQRDTGEFVVNCEQIIYVINMYEAPSAKHILGTDGDGFDVLARIMYGGRISLMVGFVVVFLETFLGIIMGGLAGYYGKWVDNLIMRLVDIFYCLPSMPIMIILGAMMDAQGNFWVLNATSIGSPLHIRNTYGQWKAINLSSYGEAIEFTTPGGQILIDQRNENRKWMYDQRHTPGVILLDDGGTPFNTSDDRCRKRNQWTDQNGNVLSPSQIMCIAQDMKNRMWIGTGTGILIIPAEVDFMNSNACHRIIIPRNDGTGLGDYLLGSEQVNCMVIDGGNRMWIGTENSGIYLIEDDTITVAHFTTDNSLLPSNTIQSMAIMPTTGELFIGTAKGIASYRSDASAPQEDLTNAYAFPNPVRPNYQGVITIAGLMENTAVNIIDESGNLVCKTRSYGGTAVWDGRIQNGRRATSGVYTALCNEPTGKHTVVKILVIR